ncbi:hypothetical protein [Synechococcus sp. BMK-MC-1]|uniref:hypothetical protein n=1 Tax=Synechococcus sp. BMK-MC-1 TaxID=1442551 RepID=UPI0016493601|nr:hypothetical protein [Synechococcus sp. BMK-MC-1]
MTTVTSPAQANASACGKQRQQQRNATPQPCTDSVLSRTQPEQPAQATPSTIRIALSFLPLLSRARGG